MVLNADVAPRYGGGWDARHGLRDAALGVAVVSRSPTLRWPAAVPDAARHGEQTSKPGLGDLLRRVPTESLQVLRAIAPLTLHVATFV